MLIIICGSGISAQARSSQIDRIPAQNILKNIESSPTVQYDHVYINGDLNLSGWNTSIYQEIEITNSIINGSMNFSGVTFLNKVNFSNTFFLGPIDFHDAIFTKKVNFSNAKFMEADFSESTFDAFVTFQKSFFGRRVRFTDINFKNTTIFSRAEFKDFGDFAGSRFYAISQFNNVFLLMCSNFRNTTFEGPAIFDNATFEGDNFEDAIFHSIASFKGTKFIAEKEKHSYWSVFFGALSAVCSLISVLFGPGGQERTHKIYNHIMIFSNNLMQRRKETLSDKIVSSKNSNGSASRFKKFDHRILNVMSFLSYLFLITTSIYIIIEYSYLKTIWWVPIFILLIALYMIRLNYNLNYSGSISNTLNKVWRIIRPNV